jgi:hypothetical protein
MRELPQTPVFTVDEARSLGWTDSALRHGVSRGRLLRVRRGVYTSRPTITRETAAVAAVRATPNAVVSHRSAALLHGLPLLGAQPSVPELTVRPREPADHPALHLHRASLRPRDIVLIGDTAVTSPARTAVDLARHRPLFTAVAAIDAVLNREMATLEDIEDVLRFCWNWPRIRRAQRAVAVADGRAESPLESVSRLVLPRLGFPPPEPQKRIFDRYGRIIGRSDFYWDDVGVIGEADGRAKYADRDVLTNEKEHQEDYEDLGLVVVRWGWEHAWSRQHVLEARLANGFERGRRRDRSGFVRLWTL